VIPETKKKKKKGKRKKEKICLSLGQLPPENAPFFDSDIRQASTKQA
jgi:hypothetical protein